MKRVSEGIVPIIAIDRKASKALHQQIYDGYRTAIVDRSVRSGQRVPSTRALASELGISRFPVLNAYAQLLAEGYFEGYVGAGTVVSNSLPEQLTSSAPGGAGMARTRSGPRPVSRRSSILPPLNRSPWARSWGAFSVGQVAFDHFPLQVWTNLVARHCRNMGVRSSDYGDPMGSPELREAVATYLRMARGVRCEAQQIMIVSGSQQALEISARVLLDPESRVWMEEPGYHYAKSVLVMAGCHLVPIPVDYAGLDVSAGIKRCPTARAVFVTPSHQYPLGVTMNASRRLHLLDWAQRSGGWIIEDDYDSEYRYEMMPVPSLQGLDCNSRVIYIGTFSKVLFPSLRLGYIVIPTDLVDRFLAVRVCMDLGPPAFYQAVLADFIREGHFARHIRRMRVLYRERRSALTNSIHKELGFAVDITGGQAGMHLSVTLQKGTDDRTVAALAAKQNLWLVPLSSSYLGEPSRQGFILGFGSTSVEEMPKAVRKLRNLLAVTVRTPMRKPARYLRPPYIGKSY